MLMRRLNLSNENNHHIDSESTSDLVPPPSELGVEQPHPAYEEYVSHVGNVGYSTDFHNPQSDSFTANNNTILPSLINNQIFHHPNFNQRGYDGTTYQQQLSQSFHPSPPQQQQSTFDYVYQQQYPQFYQRSQTDYPGYDGSNINIQADSTQSAKHQVPMHYYQVGHMYDPSNIPHDIQFNPVYMYASTEQQTEHVGNGKSNTFDSYFRQRKFRTPRAGAERADLLGETGVLKGIDETKEPSDEKSKYQESAQEADDSMFCCPSCDLKFPKQSELQSHLVVHSNSRPFKCKFCGSRCKRKSDWLRHMKNHEVAGNMAFGYKCGGIVNGQEWGCHKNYSRGDARRKHWKGKNGGKCVGQYCLATLNEDARDTRADNRTNQNHIQEVIKNVKLKYKDSSCDIYNDMASNVDNSTPQRN